MVTILKDMVEKADPETNEVVVVKPLEHGT